MLIVENLHPSSTSNGFLDLFAPFAKVLLSRLILDRNGHAEAFGYVEMASQADAAKAVAGLVVRGSGTTSFGWFLRRTSIQRRAH